MRNTKKYMEKQKKNMNTRPAERGQTLGNSGKSKSETMRQFQLVELALMWFRVNPYPTSTPLSLQKEPPLLQIKFATFSPLSSPLKCNPSSQRRQPEIGWIERVWRELFLNIRWKGEEGGNQGAGRQWALIAEVMLCKIPARWRRSTVFSRE